MGEVDDEAGHTASLVTMMESGTPLDIALLIELKAAAMVSFRPPETHTHEQTHEKRWGRAKV